jgi:hypothetical protein
MPDPLPAIFISSSHIESDARASAGAPIQNVHKPSAQSARDIRSARSARAGPVYQAIYAPSRPTRIYPVQKLDPSNMVPACALNVFPHVLQRYRARFFPWLMTLPSPIFPLAWQAGFGQNTCEASICSGVVFIVTDYRSMLFYPIL